VRHLPVSVALTHKAD